MIENDRITMAWVDLETTGLDANECVPLEVGIKLTDDQGFVLETFQVIIYEPDRNWAIKVMHGASNEIVGPMHEKSGLWDDLVDRRGDTLKRSEADDAIVEWMNDCGAPQGLPMVGNSTGSLDRPFTLVHFPKFNERLGYRNIDMSTLKELCRRHNPALYERLLPIIGTKEDAKHRVLDDIDASILEYRAYLDNFLFIEGD